MGLGFPHEAGLGAMDSSPAFTEYLRHMLSIILDIYSE